MITELLFKGGLLLIVIGALTLVMIMVTREDRFTAPKLLVGSEWICCIGAVMMSTGAIFWGMF